MSSGGEVPCEDQGVDALPRGGFGVVLVQDAFSDAVGELPGRETEVCRLELVGGLEFSALSLAFLPVRVQLPVVRLLRLRGDCDANAIGLEGLAGHQAREAVHEHRLEPRGLQPGAPEALLQLVDGRHRCTSER